MDPLQWMGAVRMRVQTADENITIIHTTPCDVKSGLFVRNKPIIKAYFNYKLLLLAKIQVHNPK